MPNHVIGNNTHPCNLSSWIGLGLSDSHLVQLIPQPLLNPVAYIPHTALMTAPGLDVSQHPSSTCYYYCDLNCSIPWWSQVLVESQSKWDTISSWSKTEPYSWQGSTHSFTMADLLSGGNAIEVCLYSTPPMPTAKQGGPSNILHVKSFGKHFIIINLLKDTVELLEKCSGIYSNRLYVPMISLYATPIPPILLVNWLLNI